jgi:hypothetical protein
MKKYLLIFALLLTGCQTDQLPQEELATFNFSTEGEVKLWKGGEVPYMLTSRSYKMDANTAEKYLKAITKIESKTSIRFIATEEKEGTLLLVQAIDSNNDFGHAELGDKTYGKNGVPQKQYTAISPNISETSLLRLLAFTLGQKSALTEKIDYEYLNTIY